MDANAELAQNMQQSPAPQTATAGDSTAALDALMSDTTSTSKKPESSKSKTLDPELLKEMVATGENTEGMFTLSDDEAKKRKEKDGEEVHEEVDEDADLKTKGKVKPEGKYLKQFKEDMLKNPDEYFLETPRGVMSIKEAMQAGYNPKTQKFEESLDEMKERHLGGLEDSDRNAIEGMFAPSNAQLRPEDAEQRGLNPNNPMVQQAAPEMPMPPEQGGLPLGAEAAPAAPAPAASGSPDILSMLGGGQ